MVQPHYGRKAAEEAKRRLSYRIDCLPACGLDSSSSPAAIYCRSREHRKNERHEGRMASARNKARTWLGGISRFICCSMRLHQCACGYTCVVRLRLRRCVPVFVCMIACHCQRSMSECVYVCGSMMMCWLASGLSHLLLLLLLASSSASASFFSS